MQIHPALLILFVGLLYVIGFGGLSLLRQQGLSIRFAVEGLVITALGTVLVFASVPVHPLLFLVVLYLVTMRVRLLIDFGNWFAGRARYDRALALFRLAGRLWPDRSGEQLVLINRGVTELRMNDPETAYHTLLGVLSDEHTRTGARHVSAALYNLGLASRRTGREAEALRRFNEAVDACPASIYAQAAQRAIEEAKKSRSAPA